MVRLEKNTILKIPAAGVLSLALNITTLAGSKTETDPFEMLLYRLFGTMLSDPKEMYTIVVQNMIFVVLFSVLFAGYIAGHFRFSCVYVFSRLKSRRGWFVQRGCELMLSAALYTAVYMAVTILICNAGSTAKFPAEHVSDVLLLYVCAWLIVVNITFTINLMSLRLGSTVSFFVSQAALAGLIYPAVNTAPSAPLAWVNPLSCVLALDAPHPGKTLITGGIILLVLIFGGMEYVNRYDVAMFDPEIN